MYVKGAKPLMQKQVKNANSFKSGGAVSAEKDMPKPSETKAKFAKGGAVKMKAGAGSGEGRMEKTAKYGQNRKSGGRCK